MLDIIRRKQKSAIIKVVFWTIIAAFVGTIFLVWGKGSDSGSGAGSVAVTIDGREISYNEFQSAYSNLYRVYQNIYRENFSPALEKQLRLHQQALDGLIEQNLLLKEADNLGFSVSRKELVDAIAEISAFQVNGVFNKDRYLQVLAYQRMTPDYFEAMQERDLLINKVQDAINKDVSVTEQDVEDEYRRQNEQVDLSFLQFSPATFEKRVLIDEPTLIDFFDKSKEEFRLPETISLKYLRFEPSRYEDEVTFDDEELLKFYRRHLDRYETPEEVKASHILIKVPQGADEKLKEKKRALIQEILDDVRAGKDFAELARARSDDPGSASQGGSLGYFTWGTMVEPFEKVAFALKPGDVSDIVETPFGFHIIKVDEHIDAGLKPIEDVIEDVTEGLKYEKVRKLAFEKALDAYNMNRKGGSIEKAAETAALKVMETGFFKQGESVGEIGVVPEIASAAFALKKDEIARPVSFEGVVYLFAVNERKESRLPELDEVRAAVEDRFRKVRGKEMAEESAEKTLDALKGGASLKDVAKKAKVTVEETGYFGRSYGAFIPRIGSNEALAETAFALTSENPLAQEVTEVDGKYFVVKLKERQEAEMSELDETKREELRESLQTRRGEDAVKERLQKLKESAEIVIAPSIQSLLESE